MLRMKAFPSLELELTGLQRQDYGQMCFLRHTNQNYVRLLVRSKKA